MMVAQVDNVLKENGVHRNDFLLLISDAARYMAKAGGDTQNDLPKLLSNHLLYPPPTQLCNADKSFNCEKQDQARFVPSH